MTIRFSALSVLASVVAVSCGDSGGSGDTMTGGDGVTYSGTITQAVLGNPLNGVEVCQADPPGDCVTSDSSGAYSLSNIPKNTHVEIQVKSPGFLSALGVFDVKDVGNDNVNAVLFDEAIVTGLFSDAGISLDTSKGSIVVGLTDAAVQHGASGYAVSIAPVAGDGPFYTSSTSVVPSLTETTDSGGAALINLPDGEYTVSVSGPGACTSGVLANSPTSWPARVRAGFLTYIVADCPDGAGSGTGGAGGAGGGGTGAGTGAGAGSGAGGN
jgi:hypothetical protein